MPSPQILPARLMRLGSMLLPRPRGPTVLGALFPGAALFGRPFSQSTSRRFPRHDDAHHGTHYDTLGVAPNATPVEVKKAFYALSKKSHPDHNPDDPTAAKRFARISEAYSVLGTPAKRAKYDLTLGIDAVAASHHHHHRPAAPRGSYHSTTGPAGGRPASGLSRRRTRFHGPPPSYHQSQHFRHANSGAQEGGYHPHPHPYYRHGAGSAGGYAGMGPGQDPFARPLRRDEMPHFDKESHHRTHRIQDERRAWRHQVRVDRHRARGRSDSSMIVNFTVISIALAVALWVPGVMHAFGDARAEKKQKSQQTPPTAQT